MPELATTTQYTNREVTRQAVYHTSAACQFDYAAWFDQIRLDEEIQGFFGVRTTDAQYTLPYIPMGFRPSCEAAEAITEGIAHDPSAPVDVTVATCVDNILFLGEPDDLKIAGGSFVHRSETVGAQLKDKKVNITCQYDFLGEHYDHTANTRSLTEKTRLKCAYVNNVVGTRQLTTRQIMAIIGLLLYASNTLRIHLAQFHFALRYYAGLDRVSPGYLNTKHRIPTPIVELLKHWSNLAAQNVPVPVWEEDVEPDYILYTDASAHGWGVMSINKTGGIMQFGQRWTETDKVTWNLNSSVAAEPLAIRKAVAHMIPAWSKRVVIYTDHQPLIWAAEKTVGKAYAYSMALNFLEDYGINGNTKFTLRFVEGIINPADPLSRNFAPPPMLHVTHIGDKHWGPHYTGGRGNGDNGWARPGSMYG